MPRQIYTQYSDVRTGDIGGYVKIKFTYAV